MSLLELQPRTDSTSHLNNVSESPSKVAFLLPKADKIYHDSNSNTSLILKSQTSISFVMQTGYLVLSQTHQRVLALAFNWTFCNSTYMTFSSYFVCGFWFFLYYILHLYSGECEEENVNSLMSCHECVHALVYCEVYDSRCGQLCKIPLS